MLVVEDCSLTQHVICTLLKELTNSVTQAFDGEQALQMCERQVGFLRGLEPNYALPSLSSLWRITRHSVADGG